MLAVLDLFAQRWHVVELGVAILQPLLVLLLCLGFIMASAHLITMLGTRWGDRDTSSKALFFSLGVHLSFAMGIIALIPEYRQRVFFSASRDSHEQFAEILPSTQDKASETRTDASTPIWNRISSQPLTNSARHSIELNRPEADQPPERPAGEIASLAPRDQVGAPLPEAMSVPVEATPAESPTAPRRQIDLPTEVVKPEARPEFKVPQSDFALPDAGGGSGDLKRLAGGSPGERSMPDFDPEKSVTDRDRVARDAIPQPDSRLASRDLPRESISPAPATLLETTQNGTAAPQPSPGTSRPNVSSSIARVRAGAGSDAGMDGDANVSRFRPGDGEGGGPIGPGTGLGPRRGEGDLAKIDSLPSMTPASPMPRFDPLAPVPAGTGKTPAAYQLRTKEQRDKAVVEFGGSDASEAAVDMSLKFLASVQHPDGYWDAKAHGAGAVRVDEEGVDRKNVGRDADVGVTALAVLAFLGKMNTTEQGQHAESVTKGLRWLAAGQRNDGFLGRDAAEYSAMYCHGMATFALAEAYALSTDKQANAWLRGPLSKAVAFTVDCQLQDGGWRYLKGQPDGDMSMFGWQLMSLRSAEAAGVVIPSASKQKMIQFLQSRGQGRQGGLASYRTGEQVTAVMTAEALFCKQMLGMQRTNPAALEAVSYLGRFGPSREQYNLYYWYYGTLAMFQYGGEPWEAWNKSVRDLLISEQLRTGPNAGSWEPRDRWGGAGGRIYSTAMATMCLEVYYRYLPLYQSVPQAAPARGPAPVQ
jgi:hypothetical protein